MNVIHVRDILRFLNQWAPPGVMMDYDNVGLLTGSSSQEVKGILVCLDVTMDVVREAQSKACNLIIAHHPLIFPKLSSVTQDTGQGKILYELIRSDISLIAAHTNLDAALDGVSFALANALGLDNLQFLDQNFAIRRKIRVTTAHPNSDEILKLLNYYSGEDAHYWEVDSEEKGLKSYEALLDKHQVPALMAALRKEEILADGTLQEVALENPSGNFGMGVIGEYPDRGLSKEDFLQIICNALDVKAIRYSGHADMIRKVAVCGGSGSFLIRKARQAGVDAFITADLKYHDYFQDPSAMLLADIGHYESELPIVESIQQELSQAFETLSVYTTTVHTNPVQMFVPGKPG